MDNIKKICIFEFNNGTTIKAAVTIFYDEGFDYYFKKAKEISWKGDEEIGRGGLRSFTISDNIYC